VIVDDGCWQLGRLLHPRFRNNFEMRSPGLLSAECKVGFPHAQCTRRDPSVNPSRSMANYRWGLSPEDSQGRSRNQEQLKSNEPRSIRFA